MKEITIRLSDEDIVSISQIVEADEADLGLVCMAILKSEGAFSPNSSARDAFVNGYVAGFTDASPALEADAS